MGNEYHYNWKVERPREEITLSTSIAPPGPEYREEDWIVRVKITRDGRAVISAGVGNAVSIPGIPQMIALLEEANRIASEEFDDGR